MRRTACLPSQGEQAPEAGGSWQRPSVLWWPPLPGVLPWRRRLYAVLPAFLSSSPGSVGQCRERTEMVCRALLVPSAHHKRSRGVRNDNRKHLIWGREQSEKRMGTRREAGPMVEVPRLSSGTPERSEVISSRREKHVRPHPVTREPSSSWTAHTSQQRAFQQEMARPDLGGTRRTKAGPNWERTGKPSGHYNRTL